MSDRRFEINTSRVGQRRFNNAMNSEGNVEMSVMNNIMSRYDFKVIKMNIIKEICFTMEPGFTVDVAAVALETAFPDVRWDSAEIGEMLIDTGAFAVDDDGAYWQIKKLIESTKGRCFGIVWQTNAGNERTMNAKFHSDNGRYSRVVSFKDNDMIRNFDPSGLKIMRTGGREYRGKLAA